MPVPVPTAIFRVFPVPVPVLVPSPSPSPDGVTAALVLMEADTEPHGPSGDSGLDPARSTGGSEPSGQFRCGTEPGQPEGGREPR